jgi:hypothetical protein
MPWSLGAFGAKREGLFSNCYRRSRRRGPLSDLSMSYSHGGLRAEMVQIGLGVWKTGLSQIPMVDHVQPSNNNDPIPYWSSS